MACRSASLVSSVEEKFWRYVDKDGPLVKAELGPCWRWTGYVFPGGHGYGTFAHGGVRLYGHRVSYELHNGPLGDGVVIRHKCNNKLCVNPQHIEPGTHADNNHDAVRDGLNAFGERNGHAKLTNDQAREVRQRAVAGERTCALAREYGVSPATVSGIKHGTVWGKVA